MDIDALHSAITESTLPDFHRLALYDEALELGKIESIFGNHTDTLRNGNGLIDKFDLVKSFFADAISLGGNLGGRAACYDNLLLGVHNQVAAGRSGVVGASALHLQALQVVAT